MQLLIEHCLPKIITLTIQPPCIELVGLRDLLSAPSFEGILGVERIIVEDHSVFLDHVRSFHGSTSSVYNQGYGKPSVVIARTRSFFAAGNPQFVHVFVRHLLALYLLEEPLDQMQVVISFQIAICPKHYLLPHAIVRLTALFLSESRVQVVRKVHSSRLLALLDQMRDPRLQVALVVSESVCVGVSLLDPGKVGI
jgi:hypothetical protein